MRNRREEGSEARLGPRRDLVMTSAEVVTKPARHGSATEASRRRGCMFQPWVICTSRGCAGFVGRVRETRRAMPTNDPRTDRELVMAHRETGDDSAREALILRYSGLARAIARRFARRGMAHDDVLQSGYLGLIQGVDRYDPSRGVPR